MPEFLRELLAGRPRWMNAIMLFCFFMALIYVPWDLFIKPIEEDKDVWFGIMFEGVAAKVSAFAHWLVYGAGAYGFWKMKSWMWPWAAIYVAQVAIGMLVWSLLELDGAKGVVSGVVTFAVFAVPTWALWQARARFQPETGSASSEAA